MSDKPEPICSQHEAAAKMSDTRELTREDIKFIQRFPNGDYARQQDKVIALCDMAMRCIKSERRIAAALDYIELHMSEDADFVEDRFVPNDALTLRSILDGSSPS